VVVVAAAVVDPPVPVPVPVLPEVVVVALWVVDDVEVATLAVVEVALAAVVDEPTVLVLTAAAVLLVAAVVVVDTGQDACTDPPTPLLVQVKLMLDLMMSVPPQLIELLYVDTVK